MSFLFTWKLFNESGFACLSMGGESKGMQILASFLKSLLAVASIAFFSLGAWSTGYITLKLRRGELRVEELPEWLQTFGDEALRNDAEGNKLKILAPYISMGIGLLVIGILIVASTWSWYQHGFDQTTLAVGIIFLIWCLIIRWHLRLGR